jgi:hypothetical protein
MSETNEIQTSNGNGRRNILLKGLAAIIVIAAIGYSAWYLLHGRWFESTEDAYANGNIVEVTPLVSGPMLAQAPTDKPVYTTNIYQQQLNEAGVCIKEIIRVNSGTTAIAQRNHS